MPGFLEFEFLIIEIYPPVVGQVWDLFFEIWILIRGMNELYC